jgi:hypothetical protein
VLSGIDRRRDLVNVVSSIFDTQFVIATVMDLRVLHVSVNKLYDTQLNLVHSVNDIYLYLRSLLLLITITRGNC